jgi:hypothetical protein
MSALGLHRPYVPGALLRKNWCSLTGRFHVPVIIDGNRRLK